MMAHDTENPEPRGNAASGSGLRTGEGREDQTAQPPLSRKLLSVLNDKGELVTVNDGTRLADVLVKLTASGTHGISAFDFPPGVRLGAFIFKLRKLGIVIDMQRKRVPDDPFGASIAHYRLNATA